MRLQITTSEIFRMFRSIDYIPLISRLNFLNDTPVFFKDTSVSWCLNPPWIHGQKRSNLRPVEPTMDSMDPTGGWSSPTNVGHSVGELAADEVGELEAYQVVLPLETKERTGRLGGLSVLSSANVVAPAQGVVRSRVVGFHQEILVLMASNHLSHPFMSGSPGWFRPSPLRSGTSSQPHPERRSRVENLRCSSLFALGIHDVPSSCPPEEIVEQLLSTLC